MTCEVHFNIPVLGKTHECCPHCLRSSLKVRDQQILTSEAANAEIISALRMVVVHNEGCPMCERDKDAVHDITCPIGHALSPDAGRTMLELAEAAKNVTKIFDALCTFDRVLALGEKEEDRQAFNRFNKAVEAVG